MWPQVGGRGNLTSPSMTADCMLDDTAINEKLKECCTAKASAIALVCTGIRTGDIVHYEDTDKGREVLRKTAAFWEREDKLDEAAHALDTAYYSGTLAIVSRQDTPIRKRQADTMSVSRQAYVCTAT